LPGSLHEEHFGACLNERARVVSATIAMAFAREMSELPAPNGRSGADPDQTENTQARPTPGQPREVSTLGTIKISDTAFEHSFVDNQLSDRAVTDRK
jgi:hypothetical protein